MTPRVETMEFEHYQRADGVSNSMLSWISEPKFPAKYYAKFVAKTLPEEEDEVNNGKMDARTFGRLFHRAILEPETLEGAFYVKPEKMSFATVDGKQWKKEHQDRVIITHKNAETLKGMASGVWSHPKARALLYGAQTERCLFAEDDHGTLRKARLDIVPSWGPIIGDPKSISELTEHNMSKACFERRYFVQAAFYVDIAALCGLDKTRFSLIFVEKIPPYTCTVRPIDGQELEWGRAVYQRDLHELRQCQETGIWPGDRLDGQPLGLPGYAEHQFKNTQNLE